VDPATVRLLRRCPATDEHAVAVTHADLRGRIRVVRHAVLATAELNFRRRGHTELAMSSARGAYEYASSCPTVEQPRATPAWNRNLKHLHRGR